MCSALDADWRQMAPSPPGRTAVQRWVDQDPCFEGAHSAHDVLAMCREGAAEGWPVLRALLRVASGDQFAQQTVLQVLLPGLLDLSRRACAKATRTCRGWVDEDELEQQVVVIGSRPAEWCKSTPREGLDVDSLAQVVAARGTSSLSGWARASRSFSLAMDSSDK